MNQAKTYTNKLISTLNKLDLNAISKLADMMLEAYQKDKHIFIFGNGGSSSTSSHMSADLNNGVSRNKKKRFKAISLTDNMATITSCSNDMAYEDIFVEQLKNFMSKGDLVIAISGSGNSKNVLKAIEYANDKGNMTVGLTGYNGGKLKQLAKFGVHAEVENMEMSEDVHLITSHIIKTILIDKIKSTK